MKHSKRSPFAKRSLGQNFLVDDQVIGKIIASLRLKEGDSVIEIGPGRGALTKELLAQGADLTALELDREFAPRLRVEFSNYEHFVCIEGDVLETDLADIVLNPPAKLVGNLPYYISTAIIQKLIGERHLFSQIVLMLQREVVDRIAAKPGDSSRGFLTVLVEDAFTVERLFDVPPTAFLPRPKVWSSVVSLVPKISEIENATLLRTIVSAAFAQKRKTIFNNLKNRFADAGATLQSAGIDPLRRAESLTNREWASLVEYIANEKEPPK